MAAIWQTNINDKLNEYLSTSQKKSYFVSAVTMVFVLVVVFFGIRPAVTAALRQNQDNKRRSEAITQLKSELDTLKTLTDQLNTKQEIVDYFSYVLPKENNQSAVLKELYYIANKANITIFSIEFKKDFDQGEAKRGLVVDSEIAVQLVHISFDGELSNIINFVGELEKQNRIYNLDAVTITPNSQEYLEQNPDSSPYSGSIDMAYYYWKTIQ